MAEPKALNLFMTEMRTGGSLNTMVGGWIAQLLGYRILFLSLDGFAPASLALWLGLVRALCPTYAGTRTWNMSGEA